ncbi:hypothetical protein NQF86_05215 [Bombella sp. TMW 2.2543]|uniref:Uncharacterized protein n=1 Tax=Bombella pluederhausensis TaxID=2967336 RepID=A0ABT3WIN4_9PROT|nr:hypothetical protein [Bombella pluederhausensis]MCX5618060.1 hypothetical protein [Bombella pluederhausensis]
MLLKNSQLIIEILLMIVLIAGIISSRLIVRRLGVIRESYTALNEMVATLDSSTEQVNSMFERVRHEVSQGDRRLSVLLDRARNVEEDLLDQKKMTQETADSLSALLERAEKQEAGMGTAMEAAQALLRQFEEQVEKQQELLEQARHAVTESVESAAGVKDGQAPHFSDQIAVPVPGRLRGPRPYLRQKDGEDQARTI